MNENHPLEKILVPTLRKNSRRLWDLGLPRWDVVAAEWSVADYFVDINARNGS